MYCFLSVHVQISFIYALISLAVSIHCVFFLYSSTHFILIKFPLHFSETIAHILGIYRETYLDGQNFAISLGNAPRKHVSENTHCHLQICRFNFLIYNYNAINCRNILNHYALFTCNDYYSTMFISYYPPSSLYLIFSPYWCSTDYYE